MFYITGSLFSLFVNDRTRLEILREIQTANLTASEAAELEFDSARLPPDTDEEGKQRSCYVKHNGKA